MHRLWYATTNIGKVASLKRHLAPAGIEVVQRALGIPEPRFEQVDRLAIFKAMVAHQEIGEPVVALDAGFFMHGLKGYPGTYVNFALKTIDVAGILRLAGMADNRACEFRHSLAYDDGTDVPHVFLDTVVGEIAPEARGVFDRSFHWSPLVLIFTPNGQKKTLGEMSRDEYEYWGEHLVPRPRHYEQFLDWYQHRNPIVSSPD